ncbi:hypothetical protein EVG20_g10363 [Dentipellis fragilis]|uniref:Peptidase A2 domain-containing protein n=1 Tax=Dentipellis fragilis TaxID=205917 RepID=A0A4Y9XS04_9AGAM|nr:hypothetical protein EVG20_g10363 [Dentipellis fragilis]
MGLPYPHDVLTSDESIADAYSPDRFEVARAHETAFIVTDNHINHEYTIGFEELLQDDFNPIEWLITSYQSLSEISSDVDSTDFALSDISNLSLESNTSTDMFLYATTPKNRHGTPMPENVIGALEQNSGRMKDFTRVIPKPLVVQVYVNDQPVRALLDSGSLADFMSTTLVDQLKLKTDVLAKPLPVQLAMSGSRSKVNHSVSVNFRYQDISETRRFDVMNIDNYDLILGTPFLFQHRVVLGLNPPQVAVQSNASLPIKGDQVTTLASLVTELRDEHLQTLRDELRSYADDICKEAVNTPLPPLRAVNHTIPLIDENKTYHWRPSKCPDPL